MIIVVEGPSAAGKTTWATAHASRSLVTERPATPPAGSPSAIARFWAEHGADRWSEALDTETRTGLAVCDTDPLKLAYAWSLWRIGHTDRSAFEVQAEAYRLVLANGRIGFADRYLVSVPTLAELEARRAGDGTRSRRNFALHARLADPVREWYGLVEDVRPGSVTWGLPDDGVPTTGVVERRRVDVDAFDALVAAARTVAVG